MRPFELIIGTGNRAKGLELAELLEPRGFQVQTLLDLTAVYDCKPLEIVEDGESFAANSQKKAIEQARHLGHWVLADDSGIEVDALQGAPGIYSARYAGLNSTDLENNTKLLTELGDLPETSRTARYVCHVAVADPNGQIRAESEAICCGTIGSEPVGTNGFGYDPLFVIREYHRTFGELGPAVKRAISHRARALRAIVPKLVALAASGEWE
ncbi:MAG: RdgB/HAM1 family non-canonical purine NTP pyrophosphatase [Pirellulales bacterium]